MENGEDGISRLTVGLLAEVNVDVAEQRDGRTLRDITDVSVIPLGWVPPTPAAAMLVVGRYTNRHLGRFTQAAAKASVEAIVAAIDRHLWAEREALRRYLSIGFVGEIRCAQKNIRAARATLTALAHYPDVWPDIASAVGDRFRAEKVSYDTYVTGVATDPTYAARWAADESIRPPIPAFLDLLHAALDARWPHWREEPLFISSPRPGCLVG